MPDRKIEIEILAKGRPAEKGIDRVKQKTKDLERQTERSGKSMVASWAKIGVGVAGLTLAFKKLSEAYAVQLKAETTLANALRINAKDGDATLNMWKEYASALQDVTLYGDEATLQQIALIKTMGLSDEQTKKVIETAMDYATAFGKDLPSAVRELTMTLSGQIGTIKRTIPAIGDYTKEQLQAGAVIDAVSVKVKGQSKAIADTPWGKSQQLANSFGDEMERLGQTLLDLSAESGALGGLTKLLSNISDGLDRSANRFRYLNDTMKDVERIKYLESELQILGDIGAIQEQYNALGLQQDLDKINYAKRLTKELEDLRNKTKENTDANAELNGVIKDREVIHIDLRKSYEELQEATEESMMMSILKSKEFGNQLEILKGNTQNIARDISTAFANMALGIDTSFKDMAQSIIMNLVRIRMEALITQAISGFTGRLQAGRTFGVNPFGEQAGMLAEGIFHTGGIVGVPSYHAGMRSDERLAKLQTGEAVINRYGASQNRGAIEAMNAGYQVGGGGNVTTAEINFNVQAIDAVSFNNYLVGNKQTIENIINNSLQTNGTVRRTIKQVV